MPVTVALPLHSVAAHQLDPRSPTTTDGRPSDINGQLANGGVNNKASWPRSGLPVVDFGRSHVADCKAAELTIRDDSQTVQSTSAVNNNSERMTYRPQITQKVNQSAV